MSEIKLNTGGARVVIPAWNPLTHNWLGSRRSRFLSVTKRLIDSKSGERQWNLYCAKCRNEFVATDKQLDDRRTVFCGCA